MKKRLFAILAVLLAIATLAVACGGVKPATPIDNGNDDSGENKQEAPSDYHYKYVAIIGVDGAGDFHRGSNEYTPNINRIFANGAVTYRALTEMPSISAQCWGSLMHGVSPNYHRLNNGSIAANPYPTDSPYPSIFRVIHEADPDAKMASIVEWEPINYGIVEDGIGVDKITLPNEKPGIHTDSDGNQYYVKVDGKVDHAYKNSAGEICLDYRDLQVTKLTLDYLDKTVPTLLYVHLGGPDVAGEYGGISWAGSGANNQFNGGWGGFGTEPYWKQVKITDEYIGQIYDKYKELGVLEDTLFIVTADHGGNDHSHGKATDSEKYIMFAATGKTVLQGNVIGDMMIRDTSAIVTYALGFENPSTWSSRVPVGLFKEVTTAKERSIPVANSSDSARYHETSATPAELPKLSQSLYLYLPLDNGSYADASGNDQTITTGGDLYSLEDGYYGNSMGFGDGYLSLPDYAPGTGDFSVSFWINTVGTPNDPAVISNKDWTSGGNKGWVLTLRENDIKFNVGNGSGSRRDITFKLPADYRDGWMHIILTVNHSENQIKLYYDFQEASGTTGDGQNMNISGVSFNSNYPLNIGQDGTGNLFYHMSGAMDDIIIFNGALTDADVAALKTYYGK
ncbi:MAG: hypothetical protein E7680_02775 [Ruminococcaceae bacterium]|nr:hypothetical protein [Oscillospiraceae bacterium]